MAERTFSMSAGLDASTVTPGRTAPDVSRTTPAREPPATPCADAAAANSKQHTATTTTQAVNGLLRIPLSCSKFDGRIIMLLNEFPDVSPVDPAKESRNQQEDGSSRKTCQVGQRSSPSGLSGTVSGGSRQRQQAPATGISSNEHDCSSTAAKFAGR